MTVVRTSKVEDFATLEARWRDLEQRANGSFFQSWTWVGCLCTERFPDPVLVEATEAGRIVALGLFNRVRRRIGPSVLYLTEAGTAALDCPYVEQNGILTEAGREEELTKLCLRRLLQSFDVVLSGVGDQVLAAARSAAGLTLIEKSHASPFADLAAIRAAGGDYLAARSANTRQQLRRSDRFYQQEGPLRVETPDSVEAAHAMLDQMAQLHQAVWLARGQPGSFAVPFFHRFHHTLIDRGFLRGEVSLLKVYSAKTIVGILYHFIWSRQMLAYQSGYNYGLHTHYAKPGLTCHHAAIRYALQQGIDGYDLLAGEDRYKRSLAETSHQQFWLRAGPVWSPRQWLLAGRQRLRHKPTDPPPAVPG